MLKVITSCIKKMFSKRALWIYLLILCVIMTAYIIYTIKLSFLNNTKPELFGDNQNIIKNLKENEKGDSYKFLIVGDSRENYPIEKQLINPVAKEINFAIMLGDACGSTRESHKYLHTTMQELNLKVPFFYIPGNKDFTTNNNAHLLNCLNSSDFKKQYGALNFSFTYHNDLFIMICSVGKNKYTQKSLKFLKKLQKIRSKYRHCFIFMHIPPHLPVNDPSKFIADNKYIPLFDKLKANYVFASHYHGYQETYFNGTNYIITGGGGASLDKKTICQFHHSIEFTISPQSISRRIIYSNGSINFNDWLKQITMQSIIPFFHNHITFSYSIMFTLSILWSLLLITAYLHIHSSKILQDKNEQLQHKYV